MGSGRVEGVGKEVQQEPCTLQLALAVSQTPLYPGHTEGDARLRDTTAQPARV